MTNQDLQQDLAQQGWHRLLRSPALLNWSSAHLKTAQACMKSPDNKKWWRYQNTWFAGVNVLGNSPTCNVGDNPPFTTWHGALASRPG